MKFARRWHISRWNTHTLSYVVPLEEHTGSSNDGQLSTQMHRASLGPNALQTAKYLQETLMHGSRSVNKWYAQQFKMKNLDQIKCKFSYIIHLCIYLIIIYLIMWALFCKTLPLSSIALLGTDHFLQFLQRNGTVYRTILGKRMILISLRDSLRSTILKRPIATFLGLS